MSDTLTASYRRLFATPDGERVLRHLIRTYGGFTTSAFVSGSPDATAYHLGQADLVKDILRRLSVQPEALLAYMRAAHEPPDQGGDSGSLTGG